MNNQEIKNFEEWNEEMVQKYNPDFYYRSSNAISDILQINE